jgi:hypothetical protein
VLRHQNPSLGACIQRRRGDTVGHGV